jgi:hypothetical protein
MSAIYDITDDPNRCRRAFLLFSLYYFIIVGGLFYVPCV